MDPDYVALGPVYPTILKKMKWHQQGLPRVTEWKRRVGDIPLVGIGGMSVSLGSVTLAGIGLAGIVGILLNIVLPRSDEQT